MSIKYEKLIQIASVILGILFTVLMLKSSKSFCEIYLSVHLIAFMWCSILLNILI